MGFLQTLRYIGLSINVQAANSYIREEIQDEGRRIQSTASNHSPILSEYILNFDSEQFWEIYTIFIRHNNGITKTVIKNSKKPI